MAARPIWYDEAFSILFSEKGLKAMLYGTLAQTGIGSADIHPLGYYTLLWLWMEMFGESLVAVRLFSILTGIVNVILIYLIGKEAVSGEKTVLLGTLFAALAPFQIHYAQEIRMYSMMTMWLLLATYAYQRGTKTHLWKWWILLAISAAFAQYTHHLASFFLVALALLPVIQRDWKTFYQLVAAGVVAMIFYVPWATQLPSQFTRVQNSYWVTKPSLVNIFNLLIVYITNTPLPNGTVGLVLFITLIVVLVAIIQTIKSTRRGNSTGIWLSYLAFMPPILLFLFSQWRPVYIERALLPSGAVFCIWLAWVINETNLSKAGQYAMIGMLGAASLLGVYQHVTYSDSPYGPYRELDAYLRQRTTHQEVVIHSNKMTMLPAKFFDRTLRQSFIRDEPGSSADTLASATQEVLGIHAESDIQSAVQNVSGVWFVILDSELKPSGIRGNKPHPVIAYLDSQYRLDLLQQWDAIKVLHYVNKP